eukprot:s1516_g1.t1
MTCIFGLIITIQLPLGDHHHQALIVDGLPRLTAYLPWFSPKRRAEQNYSQRPRLQSCDNQRVVQALAQTSTEEDEGHSYSWCRGCHISVAFAVLQTIVVTKPFVFTGWLKLANILSLAAAQRDDLVVSHVAFVVASRLLWCAEGIRGAEINVEELIQFWEGHEQHGILLARSSETLQDIEDAVLRLQGCRVAHLHGRVKVAWFLRQRSDEQAARREEEIADRDNTIRHLQAKVECLEHENASKDDWCRKRDEAARKLEGTLRTKESSFEAQLARKDQELEAKVHDIKVLEAKVRNLEDQVLFDRRQVEEIKSAHNALHQEKATRERELQEKSEELTKFLLELDAKSVGDVPSAIKGSCEAFEDAENSRLKEQLAKSEADLLMLQQWHAQMA